MRNVPSYSRSNVAHAQTSLLRVRRLTVTYSAPGGASHPALLGVDLEIKPGEVVGILGESGSGKSTLARSMLGLLPASAEVRGEILFEGRELLGLEESEWQGIRGAQIAMVFQEPGLSLSPVMRVGHQIAEVMRAHRHGEAKQRKQQVETSLRAVGFSHPERIYEAYPHQLSGGELHRVAIAQALACRPNVLLADEPTRSLDVTLQAEILEVLRDARRKSGCALLFITHNPALLAGFADRVIVMYAGRIVEEGPLATVFRRPLHPYTKGLLQLAPASLQNPGRVRGQHLPALPGSLSDSDYLSPGCIFASRCFARTEVCQTESPADVMPEEGRHVSCFNFGN
jgi:oligopeptide/dipeptide ABC transporter ATP-binding protein